MCVCVCGATAANGTVAKTREMEREQEIMYDSLFLHMSDLFIELNTVLNVRGASVLE